MPGLDFESAEDGVVCGVDEAGRGPLAGPVVAAAVILDRTCLPPSVLTDLDDSKQMPGPARDAMFDVLKTCARIGVGVCDVNEIDTWNILQATMQAMARAVRNLGLAVDCALIDGNQAPPLPCRVHCIVGGDGLSLSIAAASVVAKVTRDRMMAALAQDFPGYGWETNAGYGTPGHNRALAALGVTPHHRRSFAPVRNLLLNPRGS